MRLGGFRWEGGRGVRGGEGRGEVWVRDGDGDEGMRG